MFLKLLSTLTKDVPSMQLVANNCSCCRINIKRVSWPSYLLHFKKYGVLSACILYYKFKEFLYR